MDVWSAIRTKRMVRRFEPRPLAPEHLTRIVDAGRHAGSSKNQQRWDFVVVEDRDRLRALSEVGPYAGHVAGRGGGRRARDARPAGARRLAVARLGRRARGREHDAGGLGARGRELPGDGLRAGRSRARCSASPRTASAAGSCRSATRPTRRTSPGRRRRAAGSRSTRSSTASAGSRPATQGASGPASSTGSASGAISGAGAPSAR